LVPDPQVRFALPSCFLFLKNKWHFCLG
jgi:hypothetical protein